MKKCSKCGIEKEDKYFRQKGLQCRNCRSEMQKEFRELNRAIVNARVRAYRRKKKPEIINKEKLLEQGLKACVVCGIVKPLYLFYVRKGSSGGKHCKECHKNKRAEYYQRNKHKILEWNKKSVIKHKEKKRLYYKKWSKQNEEYIKSYNKIYKSNNLKKIKELRKAYYEKIKAKITNWKDRIKNFEDYQAKRHDYQIRNSSELKRPYVVANLKKLGFTKEQINSNPNLIENFQLSILNKRFKKELQQNTPFGVCTQCKRLVNKSEFKKTAHGGHWSICKKCQKDKQKYYYQKSKSI